MICSCKVSDLIDALGVVSKAVALRSTIPALEGVHLKADINGSVTLTANNLSIGIECWIDASVEQAGEVVLPSRMFYEISRKISNEIVSFKLDDNLLMHISSGLSKFQVSGARSSEFTDLPNFSPEHSVKINRDQLKDMISNTIFCASADENKGILTGCLIEMEDNCINMVAIDGFRIAKRSITLDQPIEFKNFVIPAKTLNELNKVIKDSQNAIEINYTSKHVNFLFDNFRLTSRLIEGEYINYRQIVPQESQYTIRCPVEPLLAAVERASLVITDDINKNPIKLEIENNEIKVSCETGAGKADDTFEVNTNNLTLEICFNNKFLLESLRACDQKEINLNFQSTNSPLVITPVNGANFLYLLLPVRTRNENQ